MKDIKVALAIGDRAGWYSTHIGNGKQRHFSGQFENDAHIFFSCDYARAVWFVGFQPAPHFALHFNQTYLMICSKKFNNYVVYLEG
jgi:hypothetical protein